MIKLLLNLMVFAGLLVLSGCGAKEPVVDETQKQEEVETVQEDTAKSVEQDSTEQDKEEDEALTAQEDDAASQTMSLEEAQSSVNSIYFDFDKFNIRSDMQEPMEKNSELLKQDTNNDVQIKVEGNCDEWGSDEYNYALGLKRAKSAKESLVVQGVDEGRITMISYGEANPVCTDKTKECWAQNRRVDFKLVP